MKKSVLEICSLFNIFSLTFNLLSFLLYFCFNFSNFHAFCYIKLILLAILLLICFISHCITYKGIYELSDRTHIYSFLEGFYALVPLIEMLIDINLDPAFQDAKYNAFNFLRVLYFSFKILMLENQKYRGFSIFFMIIIFINILVKYQIEDIPQAISFIFSIFLCISSFCTFIYILKGSLSSKDRLFYDFFKEIRHGVLIVEKLKNRDFHIKFHNQKAIAYLSTMKSKASIDDFNEKLKGFMLMEGLDHQENIKIHIKTLENKVFNGLTSMLNFYDSLINTKKYTIFQKKPKKTRFSCLKRSLRHREGLDFPMYFSKNTMEASINVSIYRSVDYRENIYYLIQIKEDIYVKENDIHRRKNDDMHVKENIEDDISFKTRLLTTISHELKTPLNGSLTLLQLLKHEDSNDPSIYIDLSIASLKLLENILNNIIDYSLLMTEQFIICMREVNIQHLMQEVFEITKAQVELKNIEYYIELDGLLARKHIYTDFHRLKQIMLNIILNAIQFTTHGSIKVDIHVIKQKPLCIEFKIKDTGVGMEEGFCKALMKKINEGDEYVLKGNHTGSCMGLMISQRLALILGTNGLHITSKFNEGTMVCFSIIDQRTDEGGENKSPTIMNERIIIGDERRNKIETIINTSKKLDGIRRKNRNSVVREVNNNNTTTTVINNTIINNNNDTYISVFKDIDDEVLKKLWTQRSTGNSKNLSIILKNHNFDHVKKQHFWCDTHKNRTLRTNTRNTSIYINHKGNHNDLHPPSVVIKNDTFQSIESCNEDISQQLMLTARHSVIHSSGLYNNSYKMASHNNIEHNMEHTIEHNIEHYIECMCEEVLIVDDDAFNLLSLELILKTFDVKVIKAMNGIDAIDKLKVQRCTSVKCRGFKLVFMDYQMPVMDGVECMKEIMKLIDRKEIGEISVIGCTAFTMREQITNFLEAGMKDVVFKPLSREIIGSILRVWMDY